MRQGKRENSFILLYKEKNESADFKIIPSDDKLPVLNVPLETLLDLFDIKDENKEKELVTFFDRSLWNRSIGQSLNVTSKV